MDRVRGFTLLELLIAVAIFALVGAMAFGGLQSVLNQKKHTMAQSQRLADLQKAYRIMQRDLEQLAPRKIRNEFGDPVDALVGGSGFNGVEFSRAGYANPAGFVRSDIQRVAYVPDQEELLRRTWRVLDRAQDTLPDDQVLVNGLRHFSVRFLDKNGEWQDQWPPTSATVTGVSTVGFPKAIEVQLELDEVGTLSWLFPLPDNFVAGSAGGAAAGTTEGTTSGGGQNGGTAAGTSGGGETKP